MDAFEFGHESCVGCLYNRYSDAHCLYYKHVCSRYNSYRFDLCSRIPSSDFLFVEQHEKVFGF